MPIHEFFKRATDGMPETSFVKPILHMLAHPLEKCLAKNLQFFSANDSRLCAEPLQLRWCQTIRDRRVNLIGFLVPKWVCLVAISHLVNRLVSLSAFSGHPPDRFRNNASKGHAKRRVHHVIVGRDPIRSELFSFHVFHEFQQIEIRRGFDVQNRIRVDAALGRSRRSAIFYAAR